VERYVLVVTFAWLDANTVEATMHPDLVWWLDALHSPSLRVVSTLSAQDETVLSDTVYY